MWQELSTAVHHRSPTCRCKMGMTQIKDAELSFVTRLLRDKQKGEIRDQMTTRRWSRQYGAKLETCIYGTEQTAESQEDTATTLCL